MVAGDRKAVLLTLSNQLALHMNTYGNNDVKTNCYFIDNKANSGIIQTPFSMWEAFAALRACMLISCLATSDEVSTKW